MAQETERPERARLFVALELPHAERDRLASWTRDVLDGDEALRLVDPAALHVTLAFLGWCESARIDRIAATALGATDGCAAPRLTPTAIAALPRRNPRVLALDLDDERGHAAALQRRVADALASAGLYAPERRGFRPHLTVARVRRGARPPGGRLPDPPALALLTREVVLYRSDLRPTGARYTALARAQLTAPPP